MKVRIGEMNKLKVERESDIAYVLEENVFLHKKQATRELEVDEEIEVFVYFDNQRRETATMTRPLVSKTEPAFLEVVDINFRLGAFLGMGIIKDLLLSRDDMPFVRAEWPQVGDKLFVRLRSSKNQLTAKIIPRYDIQQFLKPTEALEVEKEYTAYNVYKTEEGNVFFTEEGHYIYVYFKHMRKTYRLGEKVEVKITLDKGNFSYNGTLIKQKELMLDDDAQKIIDYLKSSRGEMIYTDKTAPEIIDEKFHMSKKAFKRALGTLYKNKVIALEKDKTTLIDIDK